MQNMLPFLLIGRCAKFFQITVDRVCTSPLHPKFQISIGPQIHDCYVGKINITLHERHI
uniref:Uncharacterized protein n=1 Tax=Rhizophora mucronata TaxID=61149 RepID=A0A2P2N7X6_RHIMU